MSKIKYFSDEYFWMFVLGRYANKVSLKNQTPKKALTFALKRLERYKMLNILVDEGCFDDFYFTKKQIKTLNQFLVVTFNNFEASSFALLHKKIKEKIKEATGIPKKEPKDKERDSAVASIFKSNIIFKEDCILPKGTSLFFGGNKDIELDFYKNNSTWVSQNQMVATAFAAHHFSNPIMIEYKTTRPITLTSYDPFTYTHQIGWTVGMYTGRYLQHSTNSDNRRKIIKNIFLDVSDGWIVQDLYSHRDLFLPFKTKANDIMISHKSNSLSLVKSWNPKLKLINNKTYSFINNKGKKITYPAKSLEYSTLLTLKNKSGNRNV